MDIPQRLQYFLDKKGLTANSLSKKTDVSQTMISGILRGERNPSVLTLELICDALGVTLSDFFAVESSEYPLELKQLTETVSKFTPSQLALLNQFLKSIRE
jgi:transcriptional regulator with XRE-family HTH domain